MTKVASAFTKFIAAEEGATMVEYGVMVGLITAIAVATIAAIGNKISNAFTRTDAAMTSAGIS